MTSGSLGLALVFLNFTGVFFGKSVSQLTGINPGKRLAAVRSLAEIIYWTTHRTVVGPSSLDHSNCLDL